MPSGMRPNNCQRKRICCVVRARNLFKMKLLLHHRLHRLLIRFSISRKSLLDLVGRKFEHPYSRICDRQKNHASGCANTHRCFCIFRKKELLHTYKFWRKVADGFLYRVAYLLQSKRKLRTLIRLQTSMIHPRKCRALNVYHPQAHTIKPWINTENAHTKLHPLAQRIYGGELWRFTTKNPKTIDQKVLNGREHNHENLRGDIMHA